MKYIGEFHSLKSIAYKIEIEIKANAADKKLKLSTNPFVYSIEAEDKHIYSPIKCGGATVGILSENFNTDFYSGEAQGVKVTLYNENDSNKVEWVGYIAPTAYDQNFDEYYEEVELDCIDGIASLKYLPYRSDGEHTITTFLDIILNCLKQSGCYKNFYISDNVQLTRNGTDSVIEKFRISQSNFYDERKDVTQSDDDIAWSCYDVLYEICQFLGYTLFPDGEDIYIVDYDAIRTGNNKYFKYSISGNSSQTPTSVTVSYNKYIDGSDYAANGTNVSLAEVFNKVTVKDEFNTFDSFLPNFGDINFENNITASSDPNFKKMFKYEDGSASSCGTGQFQFGDIIQQTTKDGKSDNYYVFVCGVYKDDLRLYVVKFYDSHVFNFHKYARNRSAGFPESKNDSLWGNGNFKFSELQNYNGAYYYRYYNKDITRSEYNTWWLANVNGKNYWSLANETKKAIWEKLINSNSKLEFTPAIALVNDCSDFQKHIGPSDGVDLNNKGTSINKPYKEETLKYPYMTMKSNVDSSIFGGLDAYLRIKGSLIYHDEYVTPFPMNNGANNGKLKREGDYKEADQGFIWCKLKFGRLYWNGDEWLANEDWFKLHIWTDKTRDREARKNKNIYDKEFQIIDAKTSAKNDLKDIVIPTPKEGNLEGNVEITICTRDMYGDSKRSHWGRSNSWGNNGFTRYYSGVWIIKNLEITAEINDGSASEDANSDTVYTNVIDNGAVNKMDEITFKICTYDAKKPNYSSVDYLYATGVGNTVYSTYVSSLYNKALYNKELGSYGCDNINGALRQEEHYIFKLATEYEVPRVILEVNLHNDHHKLYGTYTDKTINGKTFIASSIEVDYRKEATNIKLIEKF